ncbi:regulatory LuxR family protein [Novosphingobium sp. PhB165]|uniref:LuxR C-terminal-related transcriptional regulator n=1 Tax=Novosphingobium sp. PhB165 TaxID=2485105 RepID=UPI0010E2E235|nr:LuxR C-terminal-related transcriptional regulator [Novosphingobium sp. PhB165]TCM17916.1 regulatory LuxR family protein [Novosphingobium sp. PhB165]
MYDVTDIAQARAMLDSLTGKQVEVLDRLVLHRTTKEIARELTIAPNTVDQRITAVRDKWGTINRKDTARLYGRLVELCGKPPYEFSRVDDGDEQADETDQDLPVDPVFVLSDARPLTRHPDWTGMQPSGLAGLEAFDARFGRAGRLAAVIVLALMMALTLAAALSIAATLGRLI